MITGEGKQTKWYHRSIMLRFCWARSYISPASVMVTVRDRRNERGSGLLDSWWKDWVTAVPVYCRKHFLMDHQVRKLSHRVMHKASLFSEKWARQDPYASVSKYIIFTHVCIHKYVYWCNSGKIRGRVLHKAGAWRCWWGFISFFFICVILLHLLWQACIALF